MSGSSSVQALMAVVKKLQEQKYEFERKIQEDRHKLRSLEDELEQSAADLAVVTGRREEQLAELVAVKSRVEARQPVFLSVQLRNELEQEKVQKVMGSVDREVKGRGKELDKYESEMGGLCDMLRRNCEVSSHVRIAKRIAALEVEEREIEGSVRGLQGREVESGGVGPRGELEDWGDLVERCRWLGREMQGQVGRMKHMEDVVREEVAEMVSERNQRLMSNK
jgi:chromosome segregation ATPase